MEDFLDPLGNVTPTAAARTRRTQLALSLDTKMDAKSLPGDFGNCELATLSLMSQLCIEIVRQLDSGSLHSMPAYLTMPDFDNALSMPISRTTLLSAVVHIGRAERDLRSPTGRQQVFHLVSRWQ